MPTIAIIDGVKLVIWPRDHQPPHIHAYFGEREAWLSIATGQVIHGALPARRRKAVQSWLDANRPRVAYVWDEIRLGRWQGGRLD